MAVEMRKATLHFLVVFVLMSRSLRPVKCLQEFLGNCGDTIDIQLTPNIQSAILTVPMPESMEKYQNPAVKANCDIIISFTSGMNLLLELYFLDIMPRSSDVTTCTTGLEIFDQTGRNYYGGRICMEAWQWEERHREKKQEKVVVENSPLTFRLISQGPYRGQGFKLHFGQFRPSWPCYLREFKCQQITRCVHDDLTCDGWDDCGDYSDERYEAGCDLLTASEICALIMGVLLLIGTVAQIVIFCFKYRRLRQEYGMRSESKLPIVDNKYNMEPVLGNGRRYNSQDSIPSRYSRSTAATMARRDSDSDIVDKADLEKSDRVFNKAADNMSERSYRSNPRKTTAQSLGSVVPSDSVQKLGQYSYGSRKGRSSSQSSLAHDKANPQNIQDTSADQDSLHKERFDSRERLSDKNRERDRRRTDRYSDDDSDYDRDRRRRNSRERSRRKTDPYSDDDSDYDRDRRGRNSRERSRRRTDRYSDDDSDYDGDRRGRRRRYDSYSDDSDYEYEREKDRRRSRERYNERFEDENESNRVPGQNRDLDKHSYRKASHDRKSSRDRNRDGDGYSHEKCDDDTGRDQGTDFEKDRDRERRHSRERDRKRNRDSYDEERAYRKHFDDDDDEFNRSERRRRSVEKRRGPSAERDKLSVDLSRDENKRSRSREIQTPMERDRESPALIMPPPYAEEDPRHIYKQPASRNGQNLKPEDLPLTPANLTRETEYTNTLSSTHRNQGQSGHKTGPADQQYMSNDPAKRIEQQPAKVEYRHKEAAKPPPSRADRQNEKPPAQEITDADRRKSNDDRRERYSHSRWAPKDKRQGTPPPEYEDVAPQSSFVGISYREESV